MTIPVGAPGWLDAWSDEQRQATLAIARTKLQWLTVWLVVTAVGVVLAVALLATGNPVSPDPDLALPSGPMIVSLVVLAICAVALLLNVRGWRRVVAVFTGSAEAADLKGLRGSTAVPAFVAMLAGLAGLVWVGIYPSLAYNVNGIRGLTLPYVTTGIVALLSACCGMAAMRLWTKLHAIRPAARA